MFWNGWHWVLRFSKHTVGCTQTSVGTGPRGSPEKHSKEMFDKGRERPDWGYDRKASGKWMILPNT